MDAKKTPCHQERVPVANVKQEKVNEEEDATEKIKESKGSGKKTNQVEMNHQNIILNNDIKSHSLIRSAINFI